MAQITKEQIKRIYALGNGLGMVENGNKDDPLHLLVFGITGKDSVRHLNDKDFRAMEHELIERMKLSNHTAPLKKRKPKVPKLEVQPGMMTGAQQDYAWGLLERLARQDCVPSSATKQERMKGIVQKTLGVTVINPDEPFLWLKKEQGSKLIEWLKRYVATAERQATKKAGVG